MNALRDTLKGIVRGTVVTRNRDDLRLGIEMATSGRHVIFIEADETSVLVVRVIHDSMDCRRHLGTADALDDKA